MEGQAAMHFHLALIRQVLECFEPVRYLLLLVIMLHLLLGVKREALERTLLAHLSDRLRW